MGSGFAASGYVWDVCEGGFLDISGYILINPEKGQNAPNESTIFREGAWERFGVQHLALFLSRLIDPEKGQNAPHRPTLFSFVAL
jgi:hypothetical protein